MTTFVQKLEELDEIPAHLIPAPPKDRREMYRRIEVDIVVELRNKGLLDNEGAPNFLIVDSLLKNIEVIDDKYCSESRVAIILENFSRISPKNQIAVKHLANEVAKWERFRDFLSRRNKPE